MKGLPWKTSLAVWIPVLVLALIYGVTYLVRYDQAKNLDNRYESYLNTCQAQETAQAEKNPSAQLEVCQTLSDVEIGHGALGLPVLMENGSPGTYIP